MGDRFPSVRTLENDTESNTIFKLLGRCRGERVERQYPRHPLKKIYSFENG